MQFEFGTRFFLRNKREREVARKVKKEEEKKREKERKREREMKEERPRKTNKMETKNRMVLLLRAQTEIKLET